VVELGLTCKALRGRGERGRKAMGGEVRGIEGCRRMNGLLAR